MPKVSVCIPSYQTSAYIAETLRSVLSQSFEDFELLIEDDGSTDDSVSIIRAFDDPRISLVVKTTNEGQNKTTNNLVSRATGEYLCLLPADDVIEPEKLAKQVAYLDSHPECGIVFGWPRFIDSHGNRVEFQDKTFESLGNQPREKWFDQFKGGNCLFIATSMYRRSLHEELGEFDESLHILADMEWYVRIVQKHDLHVMQEVLAAVRARNDLSNLSAPTPQVRMRSAYDLEVVKARHYKPKLDKKRFMIATPFYEAKGYAPYIDALMRSCVALTVANIEYHYVQLSGDSYVWRARNSLASYFLESDCTHLIFIDSDEGWDLEGFLRLVKAEGDIVGAAYPVKNNWEHYGVTIHVNDDMTPKVNDQGLIHAEKVPTGFMKISRKVFETLKEKEPENWYWDVKHDTFSRVWNFFGHEMDENHIIYGEDISFCRRWLKSGGEIFIEPRVEIAHIGVKAWTGKYHDFLLRQPGGSKDPNLLKEAA